MIDQLPQGWGWEFTDAQSKYKAVSRPFHSDLVYGEVLTVEANHRAAVVKLATLVNDGLADAIEDRPRVQVV